MKSQLTFPEAAGLIVGAGVGGGVMAVPYLASRTGLLPFIPIILSAAAINIILNLLLVDVLIRDGRDLQIVELMSAYVFRGPVGKFLSWIFFTILGLSFYASLSAYITGAGEVLAGLLGIPTLGSQLIVYLFSAVIVFFGLKSVGFSEKIAVYFLLLFSVIIALGSIGVRTMSSGSILLNSVRGRGLLALFGIVMYSLNAAFAVPQVVKGLGRNPGLSVRAVVTGTLINAALILFVTVTALAVSRPVTEVAIIGIGAATNRTVEISGSLFVFVAMLTTYWSVSLALSDIVSQRLKVGSRAAWLAATAPTLILIIYQRWSFLGYLQMAGGLVALVVVYVTVPMFKRARQEHPTADDTGYIRILGSPVILGLFILGMILMSVGSFLGI